MTSPSLAGRRVSVIVPTFKEVENLPHLIDRLAKVRESSSLDLEELIMDDDSRDGSAELMAKRTESWVKLVVRTTDRGLSPAVIDGLNRATGEILVCMDADLSHPPESIPAMVAKLDDGADFVMGSRYVEGGSTSDDWGILRWLNSRVATILARPLTTTRDPMSGFFGLRQATYEKHELLNPVGYKIGLELIVKCRCERVVEVPIHFEDRQYGKSKLSFKQQMLYLKHLRRLYDFKFGGWAQFAQFLVVGGIGTAVNLLLFTVFLHLAVPDKTSVALSIFLSMVFNFILNRRFSFSAARSGSLLRQFVGFMLACSVGAVINYAITVFLIHSSPTLPKQVDALAGIAAATLFNFVTSRYLVFRTKHIREKGGK